MFLLCLVHDINVRTFRQPDKLYPLPICVQIFSKVSESALHVTKCTAVWASSDNKIHTQIRLACLT